MLDIRTYIINVSASETLLLNWKEKRVNCKKKGAAVKIIEEIVLGATVGMVIFFFFIIDYWFSTRRDKMERTVQFQKGENPNIPCPYCGTILRPSDESCPNCDILRKKYH